MGRQRRSMGTSGTSHEIHRFCWLSHHLPMGLAIVKMCKNAGTQDPHRYNWQGHN